MQTTKHWHDQVLVMDLPGQRLFLLGGEHRAILLSASPVVDTVIAHAPMGFRHWNKDQYMPSETLSST